MHSDGVRWWELVLLQHGLSHAQKRRLTSSFYSIDSGANSILSPLATEHNFGRARRVT